MKNAFEKFLRDERGAVSVDGFVVLFGTSWMLVTVAVDIGSATITVADRINDELRYNSVVYDILEGYGPGSRKARGLESDG